MTSFLSSFSLGFQKHLFLTILFLAVFHTWGFPIFFNLFIHHLSCSWPQLGDFSPSNFTSLFSPQPYVTSLPSLCASTRVGIIPWRRMYFLQAYNLSKYYSVLQLFTSWETSVMFLHGNRLIIKIKAPVSGLQIMFPKYFC